MSIYGGDFLGFQLGEFHSSQLNIIRTSDGSRYSENLTPNFSDITAQAPGVNGAYYWRTQFNQKQLAINFAFDGLTEEDLRRLKQIFNFDGVQPLIFDEYPYKKYMVKCSAPPVLKYIAFSHYESTIYKGEGTINLVAYYPYGISLKESEIKNQSSYNFINYGDIEFPIKVIYSKASAETSGINLQLKLAQNGPVLGSLQLSAFTPDTGDDYICIDTRTNLIEGLNENFKKTGKLYNKYIQSGDFFKVPTEKSVLISNENEKNWNNLKFNYLYY